MEKSEFEKLVMRVRPAMLDLCRGFLNANRLSVDPEDVVQDALLRLWGMKDRLQTESHPEALALRIAKNLCIDCFRRRVLDSVSVDSVLRRGFAWVKNQQGKTVYNVAEARKSHRLDVTFADGTIKTCPVVKKNELQGDLFDF
jgi:DNA-directed RNA polymerase specialized sigma24 family protein